MKEKDKNRVINDTYEKLKKNTESAGYYLNPDIEFTKELVEGLLTNEDRYGYWACPCRLASGNKKDDLDIICPCYYRDPDLNDYDACYCGLYVSSKIINGDKEIKPIPERRGSKNEMETIRLKNDDKLTDLSLPVYRCKVCGYLCARENPPEICPICKAKKERFERFM